MTDILERLRDLARDWGPDEPLVGDAFNEAADEIERLEADNARLRVALREIASIPTCPGAERERLIHVARKALEERDD